VRGMQGHIEFLEDTAGAHTHEGPS
jgi:hypothetical protein